MDFKSDHTIHDGLHTHQVVFHEQMMFSMDVLIIFMVLLCLLLCKLTLCFIAGLFIGKRKSKMDASSERNNQCLSLDELV